MARRKDVCDVHHFLWEKGRWKHPDLRALRDFWYCKVEIPKQGLHRYIHSQLIGIEPTRPSIAKQVLAQLQELDQTEVLFKTDDITTRLEVLIALFEDRDKKTTRSLRKQLKLVRDYQKRPP